ncbi:enoyl-CoA hydratase/isomerase family protein [Pseudenhygromyxa sp. WMMC2535]|uniref:enoyl-CoA hydratase/isomerase family protein n=1 Tax=Pseudenhygromyxa sp. WMMC2535 TaxID=2712867 RepID=UPI001557E065|nr:enoyl-CoA hydratase/isomerase family protein [Pseudenhygromyxa sp. WMMC2535]NVB41381.1 enoyl-CoA hydratase/isomerase family protein [Pseudenhygromyxa sp. WMMC2535]NVB43691.1 enoyl-CoA hydratase/isomerase family protein [Pseudenhygromyxa sp. WMMC2535]
MTTTPPTPPGLREEHPSEGVLRWVLDNQARRNAIHPAVFAWIVERSATLSGEVVLLRGAGEDAFSAGFDLSALDEQLARGDGPPDQALIAATSAMQAADATFVAVINGYVIGAGVELVAACDLRLARAGARLRLPAGRLGVVYHAAGLARVHAAFGGTVARRLLLAGQAVPIDDAQASLSALLPDNAALDAAALELAAAIREQSALSVAGNRRILRALDAAQALPADLLEAHERARVHAYSKLRR